MTKIPLFPRTEIYIFFLLFMGMAEFIEGHKEIFLLHPNHGAGIQVLSLIWMDTDEVCI